MEAFSRLNPKKSVGGLIHCNQIQKWEFLGSVLPRHTNRVTGHSLVGQKERPTLLVTPLMKEKSDQVEIRLETQGRSGESC
jgi:hypothetical protein